MAAGAISLETLTVVELPGRLGYPNHVSIGYTPPMMTKESGLRIRIQRELREQFLDVCHVQDKPAAQVIRAFMREYIARHNRNLADRSSDVSEHQANSAPHDH